MTVGSQLGRPVGASGEQTRQRIVAAAIRCVAEVGYSQASIREIARTAGMTSGSLYHYFPNKAELLAATGEEIEAIVLPRLRAAAARSEGAIARLEAVLDECGQLLREYPDLAAFEWAIRAENLVVAEQGDSGRFETMREIIVGVVDDARRTGDLGPDVDPRAVAEAIYALIYGLTEVAATLPPADFQAALAASKAMVRGALFDGA
ncbi:TetR/AcrR family transcriptional regulator [Mycobacterium asiaticum]|uniref:TetR family transcriptional regulator n=1 Tax=Mycobacterium asiaticum TaxID=1790 RepID=A0A1A3N6N6_MYCAS|nr:TetR/AcrR family transcriptional regulator [Mycobacterium asiaticum]OBK16032.1 TetR family transcriptional regulator [Mycobacterium asiaticum]